MMKWLETRSKALQALTGIVTMLVALAALIGVKLQINATERIQREQSARDIYREFLTLSISKPEFASPNYCSIRDTAQEAAYEGYVNYLLYTGEQLLRVFPDWEPTLSQHLGAHRELLCSETDWGEDAPEVQRLIGQFRERQCQGFKSSCVSPEE